jgi:hypothetical protein
MDLWSAVLHTCIITVAWLYWSEAINVNALGLLSVDSQRLQLFVRIGTVV